MVMFAGGSGIAPFRSFLQARKSTGAYGRNILFLAFKSRETFLYEDEVRQYLRDGMLEAHVTFSRDDRGLIYDQIAGEFIEKKMNPRRIDSTILEHRANLCKIIGSRALGGSAGCVYICGSTSFYETIWQTLQKCCRIDNCENILTRAFAEGRVMLDVFTTPQAMSTKLRQITLTELSRKTGHKPGERLWMGVHGYVYDVTDFCPIHPGGRFTIGNSAGLDASKTFDLVAHTNNPEVRGLLSRYLIGAIASPPSHLTKDMAELRNKWITYLRMAVESLTTVSLEVDTIGNRALWLKNGQLDICMVRKFYQFQSRFLQRIVPNLYGKLYAPCLIFSYLSRFESIKLKLSVGTINPQIAAMTNVQGSVEVKKVENDIAALGEIICNSCRLSNASEVGVGLVEYAQTIAKLDVEFLENLRDRVGSSLEVFDILQPDNDDSSKVWSVSI
jgi:cytochrome b involved in lipid metabolism